MEPALAERAPVRGGRDEAFWRGFAHEEGRRVPPRHFAAVSKTVPQISDNAETILFVLGDAQRRNPAPLYVKIDRLASAIGMNEPTCQQTLTELEGHSYVALTPARRLSPGVRVRLTQAGEEAQNRNHPTPTWSGPSLLPCSTVEASSPRYLRNGSRLGNNEGGQHGAS
jgi:hypothetical protein